MSNGNNDDDDFGSTPWPRAQPNHELPGETEEQKEARRMLNARQVGELTAMRQRQAEEREAAGFASEPVKTFAPVSINIDLNELMAYFGMEYDEDGPTGAPNRDIRQQIMEMVAGKIVKDVLGTDNDFKKTLQASIHAQLAGIVDEAMGRQFQPLDWSGQPKGEPTTLAEIIGEETKTFLSSAMAEPDRYDLSGKKGALRKFVRDEIGRQFQTELNNTLAEAKGQVLQAVKDKGAEFMTAAFADVAQKVQASVPSKTIGGV